MTATITPALTRIQRRVYNAVRDYATANGYAPSLRELAELTFQPLSTVAYQVQQLEAKGWIRRHPNRPRALVLLEPDGGDAA